MPLTLLRHATQKPPIGPLKLDFNDPISAGMLAAWAISETGSTTLYDTVGGNVAALTGPSWTGGPNGTALSLDPFGNSNYGVVSNAGLLLPNYPYTVLVDWYPLEIHGSQRVLTAQNSVDGAGIESPWMFDTNNGFQFIVNDSANANHGASTGLAITTKQWYTLVGRVDAVGKVTLFVNNTSYAGGTVGTQKASASAIQIGRFNQTFSQFSGGYFNRIYIWGRALADTEVARMHYQAEPFAMFQTRPIQKWFTVAAAAATSGPGYPVTVLVNPFVMDMARRRS